MLYFVNDLNGIELSETAIGPRVAVELLREGEWWHPAMPGKKLKINPARLDEFCDNFNRGILGEEIPTDYNHKDKNFEESVGWIQRLERFRKDGIERIRAIVDPSYELLQKIKDKKIKYISASLDLNYIDKTSNVKTPVIRGAGWTNIPFIKGMEPVEIINFSDFDGVEEGTKKDPNTPHLGKAKDKDAKNDLLPEECRSCALLMNGTCPFKGIELKLAAAGDGNCPRYEAMGSYKSDEVPGEDNDNDEINDDGGDNDMDLNDLHAMFQKQEETLGKQTELVTNLSETLTANQTKSEAAIKSLSDALVEKTKTIIELTEGTRKVRDAVWLKGLLESGFTPKAVELAERVCLRGRGYTGVVELSELSEAGTVDFAEGDFETDFKALLAEMEHRVELSEPKVHAKNTRASNDISSRADMICKDLVSKGAADDHRTYGLALAQAQKELGLGAA